MSAVAYFGIVSYSAIFRSQSLYANGSALYSMHMKYVIAVSVVVLCALMPRPTAAGEPARKVSCKSEANAQSCYWTRGRLSLSMGAPAFRLWKIGTHRVLAIYSGPSVDFAEDNEHP